MKEKEKSKKGALGLYGFLAVAAIIVGIIVLAVFVSNGTISAPGAPAALPVNPANVPTPTQVAASATVCAYSGAQGGTLPATQAIVNSSYNKWQPGTAIGAAEQVYDSTGSVKVNAAGVLTTTPGQSYSMLGTLSGYLSTIITPVQQANGQFANFTVFTTPCYTPTVVTRQLLKAVDTTMALTPVNPSGTTINNQSVGYNLTVGSGSPATIQIQMLQNGSYTDISGEGNYLPTTPASLNYGPQFAVFSSVTNLSAYLASGAAASFSEGNNGGTVQCTPYTQTPGLSSYAVPQQLKAGVLNLGGSFVCSGGFAPLDNGPQKLMYTFQAQSGWTIPSGTPLNLSFIPLQYYANSINGSTGYGAVDNVGNAINGVVPINVTFYTN